MTYLTKNIAAVRLEEAQDFMLGLIAAVRFIHYDFQNSDKYLLPLLSQFQNLNLIRSNTQPLQSLFNIPFFFFDIIIQHSIYSHSFSSFQKPNNTHSFSLNPPETLISRFISLLLDLD